MYPSFFCKQKEEYVDGNLAICTRYWISEWLQHNSNQSFETKDAIQMVLAKSIWSLISVMWNDGRFDVVEDETVKSMKHVNGHILKVIIETALLTEEEIIKMCEVVTKAGAEFIKTSTGFQQRVRLFEHVALMKKHVGEGVLVKVAGGISSIEDAENSSN